MPTGESKQLLAGLYFVVTVKQPTKWPPAKNGLDSCAGIGVAKNRLDDGATDPVQQRADRRTLKEKAAR
jgi:hypothetical protein